MMWRLRAPIGGFMADLKYNKWTKAEDRILISMAAQGYTAVDVSGVLKGRGAVAIRSHSFAIGHPVPFGDPNSLIAEFLFGQKSVALLRLPLSKAAEVFA